MGEAGCFEQRALPVEAQFAPIHAAVPLDYNDDDRTDLLLAGNARETRVRFPKYDANHGLLLRGDGTGGFSAVSQRRSGFAVQGDVRGLAAVGGRLLFARNRAPLTAYRPAAAPVVRDSSIRAPRTAR